ncbi:hypothetical protein KL910_003135 [Ogataea haglerorum]|nr:hypothetical protein KL945_002556 [Ogataea haglerorum]KAG7788507.1 hypothetical protein KL910_003135 [Ogataea haglerorum]
MSERLTKKQVKALQFKSKHSEKAAETLEKVQEAKNEQQKKKKTRRRKSKQGKKDRKILFIGNLPYNVSSEDLQKHFQSSSPDKIRIRQEKGIAFLEFETETEDYVKRVEAALKMHHTIMNNRKINVELTVGGGGNSKQRITKIKSKNEKLGKRRRQLEAKRHKHELEKRNSNAETNEDEPLTAGSTVHPSRQQLIDK